MTNKNREMMKRIAPVLILSATFPTVAWGDYPECPTSLSADVLQKWQAAAAKDAQSNLSKASEVALLIEKCFPNEVPACLKRAHDYAEAQLLKRGDTKMVLRPGDKEMLLPPSEFLAGPESGGTADNPKYVLFKGLPNTPTYKDVEKLAKEKGWPMARYKSRHSGGFDGDTASLLMIRVPGSKMEPPVDYDRYINIALPAEAEDTNPQLPSSQVNPLPKAPIPGPDSYEAEKNGTLKGLPSVFTIVTVQKRKGDRPARVLFNKFNRDNKSPYFVPEMTPEVQGRCYSCHPNGIRAISPLGFHVREDENTRGQVLPKESWLAVQEMNNSMDANNGYRASLWPELEDSTGKRRPAVNPAAYGPVVGPIHPLNRKTVRDANGQESVVYPTRTQDYIMGTDSTQGCAKANPTINLKDIFSRAPGRDNVYKLTETPPIRWEKVRDAMSCATCHNNRIRGSLNDKTSFATIQFKILVDQSMPVALHKSPNDQDTAHAGVIDELNANERIALSNCLEKEFWEEKKMLPEWLTQISCGTSQNVAEPQRAPSEVGGAPVSRAFSGAREGNPPPAVPPQGVSDGSRTRVPSARSAQDLAPSQSGNAQ